MEKSVVIVGAGIAGLSAGCYLQMNGYRTQIFELHDTPGGMARRRAVIQERRPFVAKRRREICVLTL